MMLMNNDTGPRHLRFRTLLGSSVLAISLATASLTASADVIDSSSMLSNGNVPDLQGLEWLSLDHTRNMSYLDVSGMLGSGLTDTYGNTYEPNTWRYATTLETRGLLLSLWDGTYYGPSPDNAPGAQWWQDTLGLLAFDVLDGGTLDGYDYASFFFGTPGDCGGGADICTGSVALDTNPDGPTFANLASNGQIEQTSDGDEAVGIFRSEWGINPDNTMTRNPMDSRYEIGSLLVREAPADNGGGDGGSQDVNAPAGAALLLTGLLPWLRRRRMGG